MKLVQCCDEPRGFVGGVCDHCEGEVQSEFTNLELQQQVSEWRSSSYRLEAERDKWKAAAVAFEKERDAYENALIRIERIAYSDNDVYHDIEQIEAIAHNVLNL